MQPTYDAHPGLSFATLDPADPDPAERARVAGWMEAMSRGFHQGRTSETFRAEWHRMVDTDRPAIVGAWPTTPVLGSGDLPVATYLGIDGDVNTGLPVRLPLRMITDVTVSPTHRRRGLLRTLITEDLRESAARGLPLAGLTVSEGSIYGRFGFGPAAWRHETEVDTTSRFALRAAPPDPGGLVLLEPEESWPVVSGVFDRFHERTRGSVHRPAHFRSILTASLDRDQRDADPLLRTAVHLDAAGTADGYVAYRALGHVEGRSTVHVADLVALDPATYLLLWRFLADLDLVERVRWHWSPPEDPLLHAVTDPLVLQRTRTVSLLWLRVLDVVAALEGRPWAADGTVVLEVDDPLGHAAGRFRVTTHAGRAEVAPVGDDPGVRLGADTLASLYLGGSTVRTLRAAGRLSGADDALATWAAMADGGPPPYCLTGF